MTRLHNDAGELDFPVLFRRVRSGTAAFYAAAGVSALCSAIAIPILLGKLGATGFGVYTLALSLAGLVQLPFTGLETGGTQVVSAAATGTRFGVVRSLLRLGLPVSLVASGLLGAVGTAALLVIPVTAFPNALQPSISEIAKGFAIACLGIPARCGINLLEGIFCGLFKFRTTAVLNSVLNVFQAAGSIGIVLAGGRVLALVAFWSATGVLILSVHVGIAVLLMRGHHEAPAPARAVVRDLVRQTSWLGLEAGVNGFATEADKLIISSWFSVAAAGYYSIAFRIPTMLLMMVSQYTSLYVPVAASTEQAGDRKSLRTILLLANRHILLIFLPVAAVLGVWAQPLVTWWIGAHSANVVPLLRVALLVVGVLATQQVTYALLYGLNRSRQSAAIACWQGLLRVGLALALVHQLGAVGVALAVLVSVIVGDGIFRARLLLNLLELRATYFVRALVVPAGASAVVLVGGFIMAHEQRSVILQVVIGTASLAAFGWIMLTALYADSKRQSASNVKVAAAR